MASLTDATISSRANEIILVLICPCCGKRHRVREYPTSQGGLPAQRFLLTCIGCGKTEIRSLEDIVQYRPLRTEPNVTPSRSPSASPAPTAACGADFHPSPPRQLPLQAK